MIWLACRQFRVQAAFALFALVVFAVIFGVTHPHILHLYDTVVKPCSKVGDCNSVENAFLNHYDFYEHLVQASIIFPALLGAFWGAPLVAREYENGTFRLSWTQSETRVRWLAAKLAVAGAGTAVTMGLFTLMATWWSSSWDKVNGDPFSTFDVRNITPVGYALFAFALGVALGVLLRRTLPAMAATLVIYGAVRVFYNLHIRPHLMSPLTQSESFRDPFSTNAKPAGNVPALREALIVSNTTLNKAGKVVGQNGGIGSNGDFNFNLPNRAGGHAIFTGVGRCPNVFPKAVRPPKGTVIHSGPGPATVHAMNTCINSFHLTSVLKYQPLDRYWTFQWYELGSYLILTALLGAFSLWWVRRR
jgi:ABC-type transport system involved in multi-copper enzyme maturation permease subunit